MDLAALNLCNTTTLARCTQEPSVEWNAESILCFVNAAVNNSICQVGLIKLAHNYEDLQLKEKTKFLTVSLAK